MNGRVGEIGIASIGWAISAYLTLAHFAESAIPLACPETSTINCAQVTTSSAAYLGLIPVAVLGLLWFTARFALSVWPELFGNRQKLFNLGWSLAGLVFVGYLLYTELFRVGAICLWCSAVHVCVILLFLFALNTFVAEEDPSPE